MLSNLGFNLEGNISLCGYGLVGLKHEERHLNMRIFIGAEEDDDGNLRVTNKETGETAAHVPIYNAVCSNNRNIRYGELRILKVDMKMPTVEVRQYNVEFRSNNANKWVYPGTGGCNHTPGIKIRLKNNLLNGQFLHIYAGPSKQYDPI